MEKLLTIAIPTYKTEQFLPKCLDSLVVDNALMDILEVLIVIDGSPDNSAKVAQVYADKYPNTFVVVEKENGGHGSTINRGLELATGKYFKVLDSDDWFDKASFVEFLNILKNTDADVVLTDYVRELVFENKQEVESINYPIGQTLSTISEQNAYAMARQTYKLELLKRSNLKLPEKIFYVDTIYARLPMFYAQSIVYYNIPLYRYYIGREGQSMSIENISKNREHCKYIFKFLYEKEKEISGRIKDVEFHRGYNNMIYSILSSLEYQQAEIELKEWNSYIRTNVAEPEIKKGKIYQLYQLLPFFLYKNIFDSYFRLKKLIKK